MGWFVVMVIGFALEAVGLAFAAFGLWQTWRDNAQGRPFLAPKLRRALAWIRVNVLKRPPQKVSGTGNLTAPAFEGSGTGVTWEPLDESMDLEAKIAKVQENAVKALRLASAAGHQVVVESRKRRRADEALKKRLSQTEDATKAFTQDLVVSGVPKAVTGLLLAGLGLALQGLAAVFTYNFMP